MDLENHWLTTVGLIISSLIAITSNFLLLLVFCRRRGLRTISNRFVINLLFINLLSGLFLVPLLVINKRTENAGSMENYNFSRAEFVEKIKPTNPVSTKEIIFEKLSSRVNGTLFESRQLLIDERSNNVDFIEVLASNRSVKLDDKSNVPFCQVSQFALTFLTAASILSVLLIGIEQYIAVLHPLRCQSYMSKAKSTVLILMTWVLSGIFGFASVLMQTNTLYFQNFCPEVERPNLIFAIAYFIVIILLPFASICLIYVLIYRAAHKNSSRMRKRTNRNIITRKHSVFTAIPTEECEGHILNNALEDVGGKPKLPKVRSAPNFVDLNKVNELREFVRSEAPRRNSIKRTHSEKPPRNIITSLKSKISSSSVFRYREENRTAKISILVIFMVLICHVPYGVVLILSTRLPLTSALRNFSYITLLLFISSNLLSPILFAYRNRRVQRELKKFLTLRVNHDKYTVTQPRIVVNHIETDLNKSTECIDVAAEPFLVPEVVVDCKFETEKKSILKRVCSKNWGNYKKCSFISVPDGCLDARGSFSSASTQISTEE